MAISNGERDEGIWEGNETCGDGAVEPDVDSAGDLDSGNTDFLNMSDSVHFGAEYLPFPNGRSDAFICVEAEAFGGTRFELQPPMAVEE